MDHIRSISANACFDGFTVLWMRSDLAREAQQLERFFQINALPIPAFGKAGALGLRLWLGVRVNVGGQGLLDIGAKAACFQPDSVPGLRMLAEFRILRVCRLIIPATKRTGEFAFRIVGATNKSTKATEFQRQLAIVTSLAFARVRPVFALREGDCF